MYTITNNHEPFEFEGRTITPVVSFENENTKYSMITHEGIYFIFVFSEFHQEWKLMCKFEPGFVEVLRLLPENPEDLKSLNEPYISELLNIWQTKDNQTIPVDTGFDFIKQALEKKEGE